MTESEHERRRREILRVHLQLHVPSRIHYYLCRGGPDAEDYDRCSDYREALCSRGELLVYPDEAGKTGREQYQELLEHLVDTFAVLAFSPGGITLFGAHFDATQPQEMGRGYEEWSVETLAEVFSRLLG
jgi:hypothetical protein